MLRRDHGSRLRLPRVSTALPFYSWIDFPRDAIAAAHGPFDIAQLVSVADAMDDVADGSQALSNRAVGLRPQSHDDRFAATGLDLTITGPVDNPIGLDLQELGGWEQPDIQVPQRIHQAPAPHDHELL